MPRPLRFIPEKSLVEITTRTLQGRLLLRPSPELTDLILGVIGKAQTLYGMTIHAFVFLSTHAHFLLSPASAGQLAKFMQFVNANVAKEAGRLHLWRERLWSRRYRSIVVADEKAAHARLRYILAHGAKEGLVGTPAAWPGPNCIAALTTGAILRGTWFDRSAEYLARQRGETVFPSQFATTFDVHLTPLPCLQHLTADQRQAEYRRTVGEIQAQTEAENKEKGRQPMGVAAILAQDPHSKPAGTDGRKVHGRKVPGTYCAAGRCQEPIVHGRKVPGTYCAAGRCPCRAGRCQEPIVREPIVRHLRSPSVRLKMVLQVIAFAVPEPSSKPPAKHWHRP